MNKPKPPRSNNVKDVVEEKDFLSHLDDLKRILIKACLAVLAGMILCFSFARNLFALLLIPFQQFIQSLQNNAPVLPPSLKSLSPYEALSISMKISLIGGIFFVSPYLLMLLWNYLYPALMDKEKIYGLVALWLAPLLFLVGIVFCYTLVIPLALKFLWNYTIYLGVQPDWTLSYYMNFILGFLVAFGLSFELPIAVVFLTKIGIISPQTLVEKRRYAIIIIFILAAFLTPADICSQCLLGVPLVILYEISIIFAKWLS